MQLSEYEELEYKSLDEIEFKDGDLLLCSGNHWISAIIKDGSSSQFSHVGLIYMWNGMPMLIEAVETDGVRIIPLSQYTSNYENSEMGYDGGLYHARIEGLLPVHTAIVLEKAMTLINKKFDTDGVAKAISRFYLGFGKSDNDDEYFCSELVFEAFETIDLIFEKTDKGFVYPSHIASDDRVTGLHRIKHDVPYED